MKKTLKTKLGLVTAFVLSFSSALVAETVENISKKLSTIEKPTPILRVSPKYPVSAAKVSKEGWATFNFTVEADGSVSNLQLEDNFGSKAFIKAARRAMKKWKYTPAMEDGKPVQQCVNSVRLDFLMEGEQRISSGFLWTYKEVENALNENKLSQALELLESFSPNTMYNIRESNYMHTLWIGYAKAINDEKMQLQHLKKITFNGQQESAQYKLGILNQRLLLEVKFSEFVNAKRTFQRLKKVNAAKPYLPVYKKLMNEVDALVFGVENISIPGKIQTNDYWRYDLTRNQFSITDINGALHKIEVRCANKRHIFTIEEDNTWKIPERWKHCSIDIYGDDNATFTLIELPFETTVLSEKETTAETD